LIIKKKALVTPIFQILVKKKKSQNRIGRTYLPKTWEENSSRNGYYKSQENYEIQEGRHGI
jgi:hypothetical protein